MPFLTARDERATLRPGPNVLGGAGVGAVAVASLAAHPPSAVITVRADAPAVIRRLASAGVEVRVDGRPLAAAAETLRHGARIDVGPCKLTFGDPAPARVAGSGDPAAMRTEVTPAVPDRRDAEWQLVEWQLTDVASGRTVAVPAGGLTLGREAGCDVVVTGKGVSRRHATVAPAAGGLTVTDHSANGTAVNGAVIDASRALRAGDVVRIGTTEFRVDPTGVEAAPARAAAPDATELLTALPPLGPTPVRPSAEPSGPARPYSVPAPLAVLEAGGRIGASTQFRVDRPVCAIGRGDACDVRLTDESVSASHATLLLKGGTWFVVDLGSANGTFVDGYRVAGERALAAGCTLTFGAVKCTFRPRAARGGTPRGTQRVRAGGLLRKLARIWEDGTPGGDE